MPLVSLPHWALRCDISEGVDDLEVQGRIWEFSEGGELTLFLGYVFIFKYHTQ